MPPRVERCVESLMADPNFKPKKPGQSKKDASWALCTWLDEQGKLKATTDGVKISMEKVEMLFTGPFRVVLPITGARRELVEKAGGEEVQLWLHCEASGPEIDRDGDRFSLAGLEKMVAYAQASRLPFLDGHHRDLMAAMLGDVYNPFLTEQKHFAFDVLLNSETNQFSVQLFNDVLAGKRHGASIAGIVHDAEIEEFGEDGEFGRIFNDVELIEVSRTSWPSYRDSFITLLANKVGKLSQEEFQEIVERRKEVVDLMNKSEGTMDMIVRNEDESTEVWGEEGGELVLKIVAPHGWDKKFAVSNKAWSAVKDRSKPCQFAIIKKNDDGSFSKSKSGYPHHLPGCGTIVRGGISAAAGRLAQALKSEVEGLEIPPIVSMAAEALGAEEFEAYEEKASRFDTAELKYAARHIIKHYRRDLDADPPESLVGMAKTYEDEQQEIIDLIKSLVRAIEATKTSSDEDNMEVMMEKDQDTPAAVEETPVVAPVVEIGTKEEPVVEQEEETVTETETKTEPVQEVEQSEVAGETQAEKFAKEAVLRAPDDEFAHLIFHMQRKVGDAVNEKDLAGAHKVLDLFTEVGKKTLSDLISAGLTVDNKSFLSPFEEVIEMATGRLAKSRIDRMIAFRKGAVENDLEYIRVLENIDAIDDSKIVTATAKVERVEETVSELSKEAAEFRGEIEEKSRARSEELRKIAEALTVEPVREKVGPAEETSEEPIEISEENKYEFTKAKWLNGLRRK